MYSGSSSKPVLYSTRETSREKARTRLDLTHAQHVMSGRFGSALLMFTPASLRDDSMLKYPPVPASSVKRRPATVVAAQLVSLHCVRVCARRGRSHDDWWPHLRGTTASVAGSVSRQRRGAQVGCFAQIVIGASMVTNGEHVRC